MKKVLMPYCLTSVPDTRPKIQVQYFLHSRYLPLCVSHLSNPTMLSIPHVSMPLRAALQPPPTLLLSGGEKYEESFGVTYFCCALHGCLPFVTNEQPGQE